MDPRVSSTFIPKKVTPDGAPMRRPTGGMSFFTLICSVAFIITLVASGFLFLYNSYLESSITKKDAVLDAKKQEFSQSLINDLTRLDMRLKTANDILNKHIAVSSFLHLLEQLTNKNVRFNGLEYSLSGTSTPTITLKGEARSYNALSFQSDTFRADPSFRNPIFSDTKLSDKGLIQFSVDTTVDPQLVLYKNSFSQAQSQ